MRRMHADMAGLGAEVAVVVYTRCEGPSCCYACWVWPSIGRNLGMLCANMVVRLVVLQ